MAKKIKTNVSRLLDAKKITYTMYEYTTVDGKIDGESVAEKIKKPFTQVHKTLVTIGQSQKLYTFILPVNKELNFKKAALVTQERKISLLPAKQLLPKTGYIHGGCSPLGMKKDFPIYLDISSKDLEKIIFSAGKIGAQIELLLNDFLVISNAEFAEFAK